MKGVITQHLHTAQNFREIHFFHENFREMDFTKNTMSTCGCFA